MACCEVLQKSDKVAQTNLLGESHFTPFADIVTFKILGNLEEGVFVQERLKILHTRFEKTFPGYEQVVSFPPQGYEIETQ